MKRIFGAYAYGSGPRDGCWWDRTCDLPELPVLQDRIQADVAIIGAGFTGLNAALTLAENGAKVVVLEAEQPAFGASGRNGGFCCLGGGRADDTLLDKSFGKAARLEWRQAEVKAVRHVSSLIQRFGWDVDRHSRGETLLAHRSQEISVESIEENYGVSPELFTQDALEAAGFGTAFHWAMTIPIGFGLNPRKYLAGLLQAVLTSGGRVFGNSPAKLVDGQIETQNGTVQAEKVIVATNGYSSEDVPPWLKARYMPAQSNAIVTRPLSEAECTAQAWTTDQMCYDTRHLLHYFRLLPDRRFLFGMRGGLLSGRLFEKRARKAIRNDFSKMFPAWRHVEIEGAWSGLVSLARDQMPFVGAVPDQPGVLAVLCFHGNGVAMGSYSGHLVGKLALGEHSDIPLAVRKPLSRFPLGRWRRLLMPPFYIGMSLADNL